MLKDQVISILKRVGIYHRLRSSYVFDFYLRFANKQLAENRNQEIDFYRGVLSGYEPGDLIFDIGANVGDKTDAFLRIGAKVVAVEPDQHNQLILRERFLCCRIAARPVTVVGRAVGATEGSETMWVDSPGSALNTLSQKWAEALKGNKNRLESTQDRLEFGEKIVVETTTLERLIDTYGIPFFVKIDVEGFELKVLQGLSHCVPYLSFEVNLPEFRQEGLQCIAVLEELTSSGQFNYTADCKKGLVNEKWLDAASFSQMFDRCNDKSIEVFWRTPNESTLALQ